MSDTTAQQRRKERLAKQLRANLVRRKQQAREREEVGFFNEQEMNTEEHSEKTPT